MAGKRSLSSQTRNNWLIDTLLLSSAVIASFSGIYFLFFPNGGYQGGRNPTYGMTLLFDRHSWGDIHRWGGVIMIAIVLIHLPLHWGWVKSMTRRIIRHLTGKSTNLNARSRFNILINLLVALSFFATASSGLYFLFFPGGHGRAQPDPGMSVPPFDLGFDSYLGRYSPDPGGCGAFYDPLEMGCKGDQQTFFRTFINPVRGLKNNNEATRR